MPVSKRNLITSRIELADKDELLSNSQNFRILATTLGYTRELGTVAGVGIGIGGNASFYEIPDAIKPLYGDHPRGALLFLRFRLAE